MDRELYASTISSVVEYFEGYETLAVILNVNVDDLRLWAEGKFRPPVDVFLRIVDFSRATSQDAQEQLELTALRPHEVVRRVLQDS